MREGNCTTRRETSKFGDLVRLILDILRYIKILNHTYSLCHVVQLGQILAGNKRPANEFMVRMNEAVYVKW